MTATVCLQTKTKSVKLPILLSDQTPVLLLGRDACKMDIQIWCAPDGIHINSKGTKMQIILTEPQVNLQWLGELGSDVEKKKPLSKW